ncbi:alpha/beta hydrolase [Mycobacterium sp. NPDC048908]|uniref:alpha/beta hydrolase n=1 Tax=Mycobacterium sp. NPDC048908 TaxID=3364292 RepID=UPI0037226E5F
MKQFWAWLVAVMISAGVVAAMAAGAGVASADDTTGSDAAGTTSSESTKPKESEAGSDTSSGSLKSDPVAEKPKKDDEAPDVTEHGDDPEPIDESSAPRSGAKSPANKKATESGAAKKSVRKPAKPTAAEKAAQEPAIEKAETEEPAVVAGPAADEAPAVVPVARIEPKTRAPATSAVALAAPVAAQITSTADASPLSGLISAIGTIVFNLYGAAIRLFGGPPILPVNSTVTVRSSTLRLDCGCGRDDSMEVPADWYVPDTATPPTRLIYLQHGFLAAGPWYSHTAATLAEQTNSIVVTPSITSNFFASDACWLGAPPMQEAVANLFEVDNTALADSALAAGYTGPIPDRVVLVGHSLGGGLVAGTAGSMVDNETIDPLAGVVMLDGVGLDDSMAASLDKVPDDIPIYQLAAPRYFWNQFGVGTDALLQARPGEFIGVTLVGGSHVDSMRGGNPLIQFSQQLVSGFSKPKNVAAAQILMVGWVNDMFAGNWEEGVYLDRGERLVLDTPAGRATLVDLPNSLTKPFILNPLQVFVPLGDVFFTFEPTCAARSVPATNCPGSLAA